MVHHYMEEVEKPEKTDKAVKFNVSIEPPFTDEPQTDSAPEAPEPELPEPKPACCPLTPPPIPPPLAIATSDLVEALPTILVGIAAAYAIGVLSGAFIFSPSGE